jgi:transcriptional regulator with XRE-family HTH domain
MTGDDVKKIREGMSGRVSQREFATLLGISPGGLALIETNQRGVSASLEAKIKTLVGESVVRESSASYGSPLETDVANFLLDFLEEHPNSPMLPRAIGILRRVKT